MKGYNPPTDIDVKGFLTGFDDEEYIRDISVSNYSNIAKVFIRKPEDERFHIKEYTYRPFLWSKELPEKVKTNFFRWKTIGIPLSEYEEGQESVILDGKVRKIDGEKVKYLGLTLDNEQHIFSWELQSESERMKYFRQKKEEYGIIIKEQITYYNGQKQNPRMEKGFKYLIKIKTRKRNDPRYTSNPLYLWNSRGKKNRIIGSFQNLVNFYREGGIDVYQRAGDHINKEKFFSKFDGLKTSAKILFFFDTIHALKDLEVNFFHEDFYDRNELYDFIKADEELTEDLLRNMEIAGDEINFSRVNTLKLVKYLNVKMLLKKAHEAEKIDDIFPEIKVNEEKLNELIANNINFRSRQLGRSLVYKLKTKGFDIFDSYEKYFYTISVEEQFMIQSGKRLFKGYENYEDLRIMTLDIETQAHPNFKEHPKAALDPEYGRIFQIGIYTNKGYQEVLEAKNDEEELEILIETYRIIAEQDPDLFLTYNGESFDIPFMEKRLELLGGVAEDKHGEKSAEQLIRNIFQPYYDQENVYINDYSLYNRRPARLKVGGGSENYTQTNNLSRAFCDTMFAVKRAQAINKKIPNLKLKDNIKFAKVAKENRVYIEGNKIGELQDDRRPYYINEKTGHYFANNKEIEFYRGDFTKEEIKVSKNGERRYFSSKKLFIYTEGDNIQNQQCISKCVNSYGINFLDDNQHFIADFALFKERVDESFKNLYKVLQQYDTLVAPITGIGASLKKTHSNHFAYLLSKLKEMRENFKDVKRMFPDINFKEYQQVTGSEIVKRYLIDDLWETYQLDKIYSQATFEVAKWLPTTYQRAATMGTATIWKQLLTAWSYLNGLGIPDYEEERDFNGGLVGMVSSGFHQNIVKIDYSSLYPAKFLTDVDPPKIDISGIFKPFLKYALETRLKFKALKNEAKAKGDSINEGIYDKKQLPLKIIINSFYGMLGAPIVSPFADIESAHHITAGSRQGMRHVIRWFGERGFEVVYFHTDGANFVIPKGVESYRYTGKGVEGGGNWLTKMGIEYEGVEAYVAEYNDAFMKEFMGVDIDEYAKSCINFSKSNFVYLKDKKGKEVVDVVGGAIVKKNQSEYIKDFFFDDEYDSLKVLLRGNLAEYINLYYKYLYKILDHKIQAKKIASKARVTKSIEEYQTIGKTRQAHMELAIQHNLEPKVGDWIFYVNIGENATDSDFTVDKETVGKIVLQDTSYHDFEAHLHEVFEKDRNELKEMLYNFIESEDMIMSKTRVEAGPDSKNKYSYIPKTHLIDDIDNWVGISCKHTRNKKGEYIEIKREKEINNSRLITEDDLDDNVVYNSKKYVNQFNSAVLPLWVAFDPKVREEVITNEKGERPYYLESELTPCNGIPLEKKKSAQDRIEDLLQTEEIEKDLWLKKGLSPYWAFTRQSFNPQGYFKYSKDGNYVEITKDQYENPSDDWEYVDARGLIDWMCDNPFVDYESYNVKQLKSV
jgi:DNA polymerase elongation subunit (family B)